MLNTAMIRDQKRLLIGLILLTLAFIVIVVDNFYVVWTILGIGYLFCFYESMKLFGIRNNAIYTFAVLMWALAAVYPRPSDLFFLSALIFGALLAYRRGTDTTLIYPILYPSASFLFLLALYLDFGWMALAWLVATVASTDVFAYYIGKQFGCRPFCETSPNKTWEGVIGGIGGAMIFGTLASALLVDIALGVTITFMVAIAAVFGDLFESWLKRQAGVKDSGHLFPGHGGMLDRLDGYLFGAVVMTVMLRGLI